MIFQSKKKSILNPTQFLERNRIAKSTIINGEIQSEGDFRIDGVIEGDLITKGKVIIGETGNVKGFVSCTNMDIEGVFSGKLKVVQILNLKATAQVSGEVIMGSLNVETGATFMASCQMLKESEELKSPTIEL